jgi:HlyD family secretion protein
MSPESKLENKQDEDSSTSTAKKKLPPKAKRIIIAGLLLGTVGFFAKSRYENVQRKNGTLTFQGNVDIHEVTLGFRVGGRVAEVLKQEGDKVQAGDVLAKLDTAPFTIAVNQARTSVELALAQQAKVDAGSRKEDVSESKAVLSQREANVKAAKDTFERFQKLSETGAVSQQALQDAKFAYQQASASLNASKASLQRVVQGSRAEDINIAKAQVDQAMAGAASADLNLADTELKAAEAGIISTRVVEPGVIVSPGSPAFVVSLVKPVWVRAYAAVDDLDRIKPGAKVEVYTDARPETPYLGQIGYVASQAEFTPKTVETKDLRTSLVYRFRVVVTEADDSLRQGMPVTLLIPQQSASESAPASPIGK